MQLNKANEEIEKRDQFLDNLFLSTSNKNTNTNGNGNSNSRATPATN